MCMDQLSAVVFFIATHLHTKLNILKTEHYPTLLLTNALSLYDTRLQLWTERIVDTMHVSTMEEAHFK